MDFNNKEDIQCNRIFYFYYYSRCWSYLGKVTSVGNKQPISIGDGCEVKRKNYYYVLEYYELCCKAPNTHLKFYYVFKYREPLFYIFHYVSVLFIAQVS